MMKKLTKYEQETILLTNQDTDEYSVFTCNKPFKRRLMKFAENYPEAARHENTDQYGGVMYAIKKSCISISLKPPKTQEQIEAARERAKKIGLGRKARWFIERRYFWLSFYPISESSYRQSDVLTHINRSTNPFRNDSWPLLSFNNQCRQIHRWQRRNLHNLYRWRSLRKARLRQYESAQDIQGTWNREFDNPKKK